MTWVLIIAVAWLVVSIVAALLIAGTISLADRRTRPAVSDRGNFAVDLPDASVPGPRRASRSARRPAIRHGGPPVEHQSAPRQTGTG